MSIQIENVCRHTLIINEAEAWMLLRVQKSVESLVHISSQCQTSHVVG